LGFVIDAEKAYSYVMVSDAARWNVDIPGLREAALENLDQRSDSVAATAAPGPNGFVIVNTLDGFDAVRIISPNFVII